MADKFVKKTGLDANPGTDALPYLTVRKGIENTVAANGDTVWISSGTYAESIDTEVYTIPVGTSWANALTVRAASGQTVIIAPTSGSAIQCTWNTKYVIFQDLICDCTNGTDNGISIGSNDPVNIPGYIRFVNVEVKNTIVAHKCGVLVWTGPAVGAVAGLGHNEFINCHVHHAGDATFGHGIYLTVANNLLDGCIVHDCAAFGIHLFANTSFPLEYLDNNIVKNCIAYSCSTSAGFLISGGDNILCYNCVSYGNADGFVAEFGQGGNPGTRFYNCAAYGNSNLGFRIGGNQTAAEIKNCLSYGNGTDAPSDAGTSTVLLTNRATNPSWVDPAAADFRLQAGSPAINAGTDLSSIFTTDLAGNTRPPGAWDQGPYEYAATGPSSPNSRRLIGSDSFSGGVLVQLGGNWQQLYPSIVLMYKDASGFLTSSPNSTTVNGSARWTAASFTNDQYSTVVLKNLQTTSSGASFIGVCLRASGDVDGARDMYWLAVYDLLGVIHTDMGKDIDGTTTFLVGRTDITWNVDDRIEMEAVGPLISALKSGVVLFTVSDSDLNGGAPGVIGAGTFDSTGANWEGGNLNDDETSVPAQKGRRLVFLKVGA